MASGKLSPRQKMINMMYLVLIALLALNVSKEIIKAFNLIENSLDNSTHSLVEKNKAVMGALKKQAEQSNQAAVSAQKLAESATKISDNFVAEINKVKTDLEKLTGGRKDPKIDLLVKGGKPELAQGDNMEKHANYFENDKHGVRVQNLINKARSEMLAVLDQATKDPNLSKNEKTKAYLLNKKREIEGKTSLSANDQKNSDGKMQKWYNMYLVHSPLAGVMAMLSKVENDARALESEINQALAESVSATDYKFDSLIAVVSSPSSAVLTGQTYEADIILAAYDSKANMVVTVNGQPIKVEDGKGKFTASSNQPGEYSFKVGVQVAEAGGGNKVIESEGKYSVFSPMASISAEQLNVLYVGLDNPVSVTVAGVNPKDVSVGASGITLVSIGGGRYNARVAAPGTVTISVQAKVGGRVVPMGSKLFKIKKVPRPFFQAGAVKFNGPVRLSALRVQNTAFAILENFIYEGVKFNVVAYKFTALSRSSGLIEQNVTGPSLQAVSGYLGRLKPGDFIQFTAIRAVGPGGESVYLDNVGAVLE